MGFDSAKLRFVAHANSCLNSSKLLSYMDLRISARTMLVMQFIHIILKKLN